jgi:hypothetical protein
MYGETTIPGTLTPYCSKVKPYWLYVEGLPSSGAGAAPGLNVS